MFVRPCLDSSEHVSTLVLAGTTITRGARFLQRDETRAASLYPVGREDPYPWCNHAHRRRSSEAAGPFYPAAWKPCGHPGGRHLEPSSADHHAPAGRAKTVRR